MVRTFNERRGFTLIEMGLVILLVGLLVLLLMPSMDHAREASRMAWCASNLRQLHLAMIGTEVGGESYMPLSSQWIKRVQDRDAEQALICPSDDIDFSQAGGGELARLYLHQHHEAKIDLEKGTDPSDWDNRATYLLNLLEGGASPDPQVSYWVGGQGGFLATQVMDWGGDKQVFMHLEGIQTPDEMASSDPWAVFQSKFDRAWKQRDEIRRRIQEELPVGRAMVMVWNHALMQIDMDFPIVIKTYTQDPENYGSKGLSSHWLRDGEPDAPGFYDDPAVAQLTGWDYAGDEKVITIDDGVSSYGMNSMVPAARPVQRQLLLVDYEKIVVDVDGSGMTDDDFDSLFAPRHLGVANALYGDGSVAQLRRDQADPLDLANRDLWFED